MDHTTVLTSLKEFQIIKVLIDGTPIITNIQSNKFTPTCIIMYCIMGLVKLWCFNIRRIDTVFTGFTEKT